MKKDSITIAEIEHLAELSGLNFNDVEKRTMQNEVSGIINLLNQCASIEDDDLEYNQEQSISDLREDVVVPSINRETLLNNAPNCKSGYVAVPKVVD